MFLTLTKYLSIIKQNEFAQEKKRYITKRKISNGCFQGSFGIFANTYRRREKKKEAKRRYIEWGYSLYNERRR